jgi:hypothetical protein
MVIAQPGCILASFRRRRDWFVMVNRVFWVAVLNTVNWLAVVTQRLGWV